MTDTQMPVATNLGKAYRAGYNWCMLDMRGPAPVLDTDSERAAWTLGYNHAFIVQKRAEG